jgi:hypothetical protein
MDDTFAIDTLRLIVLAAETVQRDQAVLYSNYF